MAGNSAGGDKTVRFGAIPYDNQIAFAANQLNPRSGWKFTMETLATFFTKLADYEGTPAANLVSRWKPRDVKKISEAFDTALDRSVIDLSVKGSTSVQALGNRVADAVAEGLGKCLRAYRMCECSGQGYPDRRLEAVGDNRSFAFELKAKTRFNPRDTNRVILTSATGKLRRNFPTGKPI